MEGSKIWLDHHHQQKTLFPVWDHIHVCFVCVCMCTLAKQKIWSLPHLSGVSYAAPQIFLALPISEALDYFFYPGCHEIDQIRMSSNWMHRGTTTSPSPPAHAICLSLPPGAPLSPWRCENLWDPPVAHTCTNWKSEGGNTACGKPFTDEIQKLRVKFFSLLSLVGRGLSWDTEFHTRFWETALRDRAVSCTC